MAGVSQEHPGKGGRERPPGSIRLCLSLRCKAVAESLCAELARGGVAQLAEILGVAFPGRSLSEARYRSCSATAAPESGKRTRSLPEARLQQQRLPAQHELSELGLSKVPQLRATSE